MRSRMGSAGRGLPRGCRGPPRLWVRLPGSGWGLRPCPALHMMAVSPPHACTCVHTWGFVPSAVTQPRKLLPRSWDDVPVSPSFLPPGHWHWDAGAGSGMAQLDLARCSTAWHSQGSSEVLAPVSCSCSELPMDPEHGEHTHVQSLPCASTCVCCGCAHRVGHWCPLCLTRSGA